VLHYGFLMDDVHSVVDMSTTKLKTGYYLDVYPDPEFDGFVDGVKQMFQPRNDYLTINVRSILTNYRILLIPRLHDEANMKQT